MMPGHASNGETMSEEDKNRLVQSQSENRSKIYIHPDHFIVTDSEDLVFCRAVEVDTVGFNRAVEVEDTIGLVKLGEDEPYMRLNEEAGMIKSEAEEFVENILIEVSMEAVNNPRAILNRALSMVNTQTSELSMQEMVDLEFARQNTNIINNETVMLEEETYI
jgi:hypothetical protein